MDRFDHQARYEVKGDIIKALVLAESINRENILIRPDLLERLNSLPGNDGRIVLRTLDFHLYGRKDKTELGLAKVGIIKSEHKGVSLNLRDIDDLVKVTEILMRHPIYGEKVKKSIEFAFLKAFTSVFGDGFLDSDITQDLSPEELENVVIKKRGRLGLKEKTCYILKVFRILDKIKEHSDYYISELCYGDLTLALNSMNSICDDVLSNSNEREIIRFFNLVVRNALLGSEPKLSSYDDKEIKNIEQKMKATSETIVVSLFFSSPFLNKPLILKEDWSWDEIRVTDKKVLK
ncbi:MAG: hypothetical protein QXU18_11090 [Thermoplasmatales archaeon]